MYLLFQGWMANYCGWVELCAHYFAYLVASIIPCVVLIGWQSVILFILAIIYALIPNLSYGWYLLKINQPTSALLWWFVIMSKTAWVYSGNWLLQCLAYQLLMVDYWPTVDILGCGLLRWDSGEVLRDNSNIKTYQDWLLPYKNR